VWNRNHVDYIEITAAEPLGVGHRAGYYQESGALRDMVANHLMQLLALTAMEAPVAFDADAVLLLDALRGDATLFTRRDGVEAQWRLITPILDAWAADTAAPLPTYAAGSDGPAEADALLDRKGHRWRAITDNLGACAR